MTLRFLAPHHIGGALLLGALQSGCDDEPFDWCTEAQVAEERNFVRGRGRVTIHYEGDRLPTDTVEIEPYVKVESGSLLVQGCGKSGGDLWRFRAGFSGLMAGATAHTISGAEGDANYTGEVYRCEDGDCTGNNMVTVSKADSERSPASGSVSAYDPGAGTFKAGLADKYETVLGETVTDSETTTISLDIQWDVAGE